MSLNKVGFTHTDGAVGQRVDYEQGVAPEYPERFYMASGGYTPTKLTANQIPLQSNAPTLDLAPFTARVDTALKAEAELNSIVFKDKTGWSIESFTSQETSGEGTNGRAAQIIDGNTVPIGTLHGQVHRQPIRISLSWIQNLATGKGL